MGRRLTKIERDQIVPDIITMLDERAYDHQIFAAMKEKYDISRRTAQRYLSRARDERILRTQKPAEEHRVDAYEFYLSVTRDKNATAGEKVRAQNSIDKLLGLRRPVQTHGTQIQVSVTKDELKGMSDAELDELERRIAGTD